MENRGKKIASATHTIQNLLHELHELQTVLVSSKSSTPSPESSPIENWKPARGVDHLGSTRSVRKKRVSPILYSRNRTPHSRGKIGVDRTPLGALLRGGPPVDDTPSTSASGNGSIRKVGATPGSRAYSRSPDYLGLRRENARLEEEARELRQEMKFLKKQLKVSRLDKEEALRSFREMRERKEEQVAVNEKLRLAWQASKKEKKGLTDRLEISSRSFSLMKAKYRSVNQEVIDLTFDLASMKQDFAYTYTMVDDGAVAVIEQALGALTDFAEREKMLVSALEDAQEGADHLEDQVVLLNEVYRIDAAEKTRVISALTEENENIKASLQGKVADLEHILESKNAELDAKNEELTNIVASGEVIQEKIDQVGLITEMMEEKKDAIIAEVAYTADHNTKLLGQLREKDEEIRFLREKLGRGPPLQRSLGSNRGSDSKPKESTNDDATRDTAVGAELKAFDEKSSTGHALKRTLGSRKRESAEPEKSAIADASALNDGLAMDTDKVTVADGTDDTGEAGTVDATGDTTVGAASKPTGVKPSRGPALKRTLGSRRRSFY